MYGYYRFSGASVSWNPEFDLILPVATNWAICVACNSVYDGSPGAAVIPIWVNSTTIRFKGFNQNSDRMPYIIVAY